MGTSRPIRDLFRPAAHNTVGRKQVKTILRAQAHDLEERTKELNCLYSISNLASNQDIPSKDILQQTVDLIPPAWQYPEITCARVILEDQEFRTENFSEPIWCQASDIVANGVRVGTVEVCYLEQRPEADEGPFPKEKRKLIDTIAQQLGRIVEHRQDMEVLQRSEQEYRVLCESILDGLIGIDAETMKVIFSNQRAAAIFGFDSSGDMIGGNPLDLVHTKDRDRVLELIVEGIFRKDLHEISEFRTIARTGKERWVRAVGTRTEYKGRLTALVSLRHITEHERVEEEIRTLNEEFEQRVTERTTQLQAVNKELEAFAYSVSHDLRAPLRSIEGFSQVLLEDYAQWLDTQGRDYLQRVCSASRRMAQLIDDLLNLSRVTRSEMLRDTVDLSALAQPIVTELQQSQPERQAEFVITPDLTANGDIHLLRVALENLLGNAWKFSKKRPRTRIELGCIESNGPPVYFVRDNGVGFDMAYADKLFSGFQRLHSPAEYEGTGIGLTTVQRIIDRHGGTIWAESAVDQGATFYFTLLPEGGVK